MIALRTALTCLMLGTLFGCADLPGVGRYRVDVQEMQAQLLRLIARLPEEQAEMLRPQLDDMLASLHDTEFVLHDDKTFEGVTESSDGTSKIRGTWEIRGEQISLLQTHEDGEPNREERVGMFYGRSIRFSEGEGRDRLEVVLRKIPASP